MLKIKLLFPSLLVIFQSSAFAESSMCITSPTVKNVAYCYQNDFDKIGSFKVPSAPARIETLKGDNIMDYVVSDLKKHFLEWKNVKNSGLTEVNLGDQVAFEVSIASKKVLAAPYVPLSILRKTPVSMHSNEGFLFDGEVASELVYFFTSKI